jgi:hypothetical protein
VPRPCPPLALSGGLGRDAERQLLTHSADMGDVLASRLQPLDAARIHVSCKAQLLDIAFAFGLNVGQGFVCGRQ